MEVTCKAKRIVHRRKHIVPYKEWTKFWIDH